MAQTVKNLPIMWKTRVQFLGREGALEEGMATHSSILACKISLQRSLMGCSPWGCKEWDATEWLTLNHTVGCMLKVIKAVDGIWVTGQLTLKSGNYPELSTWAPRDHKGP